MVVILKESLRAEVFVNMLWDETIEDFKVKTLILEGTGQTWDRDFQNAYGEYMNLDPGPPFIIQCNVLIENIHDEDGNVTDWGSLNIESGGEILDPFEIIFAPDEDQTYCEGEIRSYGNLNFVGTPTDPIIFKGKYKIRTHRPGNPAPDSLVNESQIHFEYCVFDYWEPYIAGPPVNFDGGHVSVENCIFRNFHDCSGVLSFYDPLYASTQGPVWNCIVRNCFFDNNSVVGQHLVSMQHGRFVIDNNRFESNITEATDNSSMIYILGHIDTLKNNAALNNTVNSLIFYHVVTGAHSYIKSSDDLPIVVDDMFIHEDSTLVIGPGSVIKPYHYGDWPRNVWAHVNGHMKIENAIITSWQNDEVGGDVDLQPQPDYIPRCNYIYVDTGGSVEITNTDISYAEKGVEAIGDVVMDSCRLQIIKDEGIEFRPIGNNILQVSNTTIRAVGNSGIVVDARNSQGLEVSLDSVSVIHTVGDGLELYLSECSHVMSVDINGCIIANNNGSGIYCPADFGLNCFNVSNSIIAGNYNSGILLYKSGAETVNVNLHSNAVIGHRLDGISVQAGTPSITNNTVGQNGRKGIAISSFIYQPGSMLVANNILIKNQRGFEKGPEELCPFHHNVFWDNEITFYFNTPDGGLWTIEELQALGGDYVTNMQTDPEFLCEVNGTVDTVIWDEKRNISIVVDGSADFGELDHQYAIYQVDTSWNIWFMVSEVKDDSILIDADITESVNTGDSYIIFDYHLAPSSPLIEAGNNPVVAVATDIDGEERIMDGDESGTAVVDIGADEFNPYPDAPEPIDIICPVAGQVCLAGDTIVIEWTAEDANSVDIFYTLDYQQGEIVWLPIAWSHPADSNSVPWRTPPDALAAKCCIRIQNSDDENHRAKSDLFRIKPYLLTRFDADSTYDAYASDLDGWSIPNDSASMWPVEWYSQFDYAEGIDPFTEDEYPLFFEWLGAESKSFPDWPLWVQAFGIDACFYSIPGRLLHKPATVLSWAEIIDEWGGSCAGLTASSLAAFDDSALFKLTFPEAGNFSDLYTLAVNDDRRLVINLVWTRLFAKSAWDHLVANSTKRPAQTLKEIRDMLLADERLDADLYIEHDSLLEAHAVMPYRVDQDSANPNIWRLRVYDSNAPGDTNRVIEIDTAAEHWDYLPMPGYQGSAGFFLRNPALDFLDIMELGAGARSAVPVPRLADRSDWMTVGLRNTDNVTIRAHSGDSAGFSLDAGFNTIPGTVPQIPPAGSRRGPVGYLLPSDEYRIELTGYQAPLALVTADFDSVKYAFGREPAASSERDDLLVRDGLWAMNHDDIAHIIFMISLQPVDTCQRFLRVADLSLGPGDSIRIKAETTGEVFVDNCGPQTWYSFDLWYASHTVGYIAGSQLIPLDENRSHIISPQWDNPGQTEVKVYIDIGSDGVIDDSMDVPVEIVTSADDPGESSLPYRFELNQNYPNPFNPTTTIDYSIPERSHVNIDVYNVLGQKIRTMVDREESAGSYTITWDGTNSDGSAVATGIYLYRFQAGDYVETKKMLLMK